jgi:hypothetical protein
VGVFGDVGGEFAVWADVAAVERPAGGPSATTTTDTNGHIIIQNYGQQTDRRSTLPTTRTPDTKINYIDPSA